MNSATTDCSHSGEVVDTRIDVAICNLQYAIPVDTAWLHEAAVAILREEQITSAEISIALVDDSTIHEVNRKYLDHDYPTDVISFRLDDAVPDGSASRMEGEIVISGETARRSANHLGCLPEHELMLYLVHGLLHLCGFDDLTRQDQERMRAREHSHLKKLGIRPHYES